MTISWPSSPFFTCHFLFLIIPEETVGFFLREGHKRSDLFTDLFFSYPKQQTGEEEVTEGTDAPKRTSHHIQASPLVLGSRCKEINGQKLIVIPREINRPWMVRRC